MQRIIQRAAALLDRSPSLFNRDVRLHELNQRFLWFIMFRFMVVFVFLTLSIVKSFTFPHILVSKPTFLLLAAILFLSNALYWFHYKASVRTQDAGIFEKKVSVNVQIQIIVDFIILGFLVYQLGGIESPLVYFFLLHNVISCLFFNNQVSLFNTILSLAIIYFITIGQLIGLLPERHFVFAHESALYFSNHITLSYYLLGITVIYLIVWFFATSITNSLKLHEKELQKTINDLLEMDKEKTRYMLITTHELKAPFSAIESYVNVMLEGFAGEISAKAHEIMVKIKLRCQLLTNIITKMLQLANISSINDRGEKIAMTKMDILLVADKIAKKFRGVAEAKGVKIVIKENDDAIIFANLEQMEILLNNILSNAVTYCYPNTDIVVEMSVSKNRIRILSVSDKGIGIGKGHIEKVFHEYFKTEKAASINKSSTGLGLSIAKEIMDVHKGRIWIDSEEGVGTAVNMQFKK